MSLDLPGLGFASPETGRRGPSAAREAAPPCYVAGSENRLVAKVVSRLLVCDSKERPPWSSITLVGPTGCGKSHLARGVAEAWSARLGDGEVLTLNTAEFRQRLDEAVRTHKTEHFRARVRGCQLLVLEDLHRLHDSRHVRDELRATLDTLRQREATVLVTSARAQSEVAALDRGLISRFSEGVTLDIAPLSIESRAELLCQALRAGGCLLEAPAAQELSSALSGDARRVLGAAARLRERFGSLGRINEQHAKAFLADERRPTSPPLREIATAVARYYGMSVATMRSSTRKQPVVLARAVAIYLAREFTPLSYDEIGRFFGGRDHTTIMHNHQRIDSSIAGDHALRSAVSELRQKLKPS